MSHIILATDIFGYTNAIETLKHRFESLGEAVHILDPYNAKQMNFHNENEAYATFIQTCGLENYAKMCQKALDDLCDEEVILIGFSMGASAIWKALDGRDDMQIKCFFGFYTSQIRHFLDAKLYIPCTLIFPESEKHFDVDVVIKKLNRHENITCIKTEYLHGFMNPFSINYTVNGSKNFHQFLENQVISLLES